MACIFFYFSHCDDNQPSVPQLWAALLEQLIQQIDTPDNIAPGLRSRFYNSLAGDFIYPTAYINLFHQQASMFKTVYVVIDALDLCAEYCHGATTQTIRETFVELPQNVRVLFSCSNNVQATHLGVQQRIQVKPDPADVEAYVKGRVGLSMKLQHLLQDNQEMEFLVKGIIDQTQESKMYSSSVPILKRH
jgi:hypothetical protein